MGEGMVDWKKYFELFAKLCPKTSVNIETISGFNRELPFKKEEFWKAWAEREAKGIRQVSRLGKARQTTRRATSYPMELIARKPIKTINVARLNAASNTVNQLGSGFVADRLEARSADVPP